MLDSMGALTILSKPKKKLKFFVDLRHFKERVNYMFKVLMFTREKYVYSTMTTLKQMCK